VIKQKSPELKAIEHRVILRMYSFYSFRGRKKLTYAKKEKRQSLRIRWRVHNWEKEKSCDRDPTLRV